MVIFSKRAVWLSLFLILLLATFFRIWRIESHLPGLYHDEAYNGLDALSLLEGKTFPQFYEGWELYPEDAHADRPPVQTRFPIFFEGNYGREPLHVYLMALSISLLGATPVAIRIVPAAAGILAVFTTFLAAYAWYGEKGKGKLRAMTALFAALTLSILYPAVHFSRFGIRAMVFVPVETLAVAFFWWGVNRGEGDPIVSRGLRSWLFFGLAGFFLGLGLYTFAAARLFPFVWLIFVPLWFIIERGAISKFGRYLLGMAGIAIMTALPLLWFFARYPYYFFFRIAYVANKGKGAVEGKPWLTWIYNVGRVGQGLILLGETHLRHNLPGRPYLDFIQAALFIWGLILTLRQALKPRILFLIIWLVVMLLPSILSGDAPHFGRLIGAAAPLAIIIALSSTWLFQKLVFLLQKVVSESASHVAALAMVIPLFLVSTILTAKDYFISYAQHPDLAGDFYEADLQLGQFAASQSTDTSLYLTPTQEELATIYFALEDPDRLKNYQGDATLIPLGIPGRPVLYLARSGDEGSLRNLRQVLPAGSERSKREGFYPFFQAESPYYLFDRRKAEFEYGQEIRLIGWEMAEGERDLSISLFWQAVGQIDVDYTAYIHLIGPDSQLLTQIDRPPAGYPTSDWQVGEVILDRFTVPKPEKFDPQKSYSISTGFYYLPTLERLGEPFTFPVE